MKAADYHLIATRKENAMKRSVLRRICALLIIFSMFSAAMIWLEAKEVSAAYTMCPSCGGTGMKSITIMQQQFSTDPVTGFPRTIMVPSTSLYPCSSCGGSGRIFVYSGSSSSSGSSSGGMSEEKVKYGTVLDATDGIGDYEDGPNLLDGKEDTKFNVLATSMYIIWKAPKTIRVSSYTITTANDTATYKGRNPKTWVLYGSNKKLSRDAKGWKKIHSVKNDKKLKPVNFKKFTYKLKKPAKPYRYYKLEIEDNKGADCTQLSEFTLKGKPVTVKKPSISVASRSGTSAKLKWKKSGGAKGYQIQYSMSPKFKNSQKAVVNGASKVTKTIKGLKNGKTYYVRVRAFKKISGETIYSGWSKKKKL